MAPCFSATRIKTVFTLLSIIAAVCYLSGQNSENVFTDDAGLCRTDEVHEKRMSEDTVYRNGFLRHSQLLDSVLANSVRTRSSQPPQYTIPIVVHIIHLGEDVGVGSNISDEQVHAAIAGLNDRFANAVGMGLDIEIDFCLATRAPDGCATSGILRVDGSEVADYAADGIEYDNCGANEQDIKDLSRWPTSEYYNVWVVHDICGNYAGYAYYPNGGPYDGTVIIDNSMTYNSRTLAHELGHGLNLRHTFNGDNDGDDCPLNDNCMTQGDLICDTPPHKRGDCGSSNPCMGGGTWENSRYNYMSYCATQLALGRFTSDQRDRMRAAMEVFPRSALLNSEGCDTPLQGEILSSDDPMCPGDERILEGFPDDGVFEVISGPGDISGNTLTALEEGTIIIEFVSCGGILQQEIIVYPAPDPEIISDNAPMCVDEERVLSAIPAGGQFDVLSGPGLIDGNTLLALGSGVIDVVYTVSENDCEGETFTSIEVFDNPQPFFENDDSGMCVGDTRVMLAQPPGGDFFITSGPGSLNGDVLSADSAGIIQVEYVVTENGCTGETLYEVESDTIPVVDIITEGDTVCFDEMVELIGVPDGGMFTIVTGPGVIDSGFLVMDQFGVAIVAYEFGADGCSASDTISVSFIEEELPQIMTVDTILCVGDTSLILVSPDDGNFTLLNGEAIIFENMIAPIAPGDISLQYRTCAGADTQHILANIVPEPVMLNSDDPVCLGTVLELQPSIPGGEFMVLSGPGAIAGNVLEAIGEGEIIVQYAITQDGCTGYATQSIPAQGFEDVFVTLDEDVLMANIADAEFQWVDCENQYEPIAGETGPDFIVTTSGEYALVTVQGVCQDTSECVQVVITGIEEPAEDIDVRIVPNPSDGVFSVSLRTVSEEALVIVRDALGRQVWQDRYRDESLVIDLGGASAGVYFVQVNSDGRNVVRKIVVQ